MSQDEFRYQFDSLAWLRSQEVLDRKILLLDLNFWIQMSKSESKLQCELKDRIAELVSARRLLCPVSPSLIMELGKQSPSPFRDVQSRLMDDFSGGVAIKLGPRVFPLEYEAAANGQRIDRAVVFSHYFDALMEKPFAFQSPSALPDAVARAAVGILLESQLQVSITEFMNTSFSQEIDPAVTRMSNNFRDMAEHHKEWAKKQKLTRKQIEKAEFQSLRDAILPDISPVIETTCSGTRMLEILDDCPTFWCIYQAYTALRRRGSVKQNDIWDVLNIAPAIPYVDCVASDRGTRHIFKQQLGAEKRYGSRIISSESDLLLWLDEQMKY